MQEFELLFLLCKYFLVKYGETKSGRCLVATELLAFSFALALVVVVVIVVVVVRMVVVVVIVVISVFAALLALALTIVVIMIMVVVMIVIVVTMMIRGALAFPLSAVVCGRMVVIVVIGSIVILVIMIVVIRIVVRMMIIVVVIVIVVVRRSLGLFEIARAILFWNSTTIPQTHHYALFVHCFAVVGRHLDRRSDTCSQREEQKKSNRGKRFHGLRKRSGRSINVTGLR